MWGYNSRYTEIKYKFAFGLLDFVTLIFNKSFRGGEFPNIMKYAEVYPVSKRKGHLDKENDRSTSIPSYMSKIFERLISVK